MTITVAPNSVVSTKVPTFRDVWPQIFSTFIIMSAVAQIGVGLAYSGVLIPQLADDPYINGFDKRAASWTAGIFAVAEIGGALSGKIMDKIGRKKCFLMSQFPLVISWWILTFTYYSIWPIYLSRVLSGYGSGVMCTVVYVYISEISHARFRGTLSVMTSVSASFGMLMATVLGVLVNWHYMSLIFGVMSLGSIILSFYLPESPHWLMSMTNSPPEEAMTQLRFLNRPDWLYQEAWDQIVQAEFKNKEAPESTKGLIFQLKQRTSYMPLILLTIMFILQQFSGTYLVIFYSVNLFASVGKNLQGIVTVDGAVMAMGTLRLVITILSVITSKCLSKNQIMIVSGIFTSLSAATVSICMRLNDVRTIEFDSAGYETVTDASSAASTAGTILLLLFLACGAFGIMIIPWTLPSDLLSTSMRGFGNVYSFVLSNLLIFGIVKIFPLSLDYISLPVIFGIFAAFAIAFTLFVWLFLPDTSGKQFDDIAKCFEKKPRRK